MLNNSSDIIPNSNPNNQSKNHNIIQIYTDGACSNNPGPGGLGICMLFNNHTKTYSEGYKLTTNNRMELLAIIIALSFIKKQYPIKIYSDSKYVIDAIKKRWLHKWESRGFVKVKNPDLWQKLSILMKEFKDIDFIWVKGHASNIYNNLCDQLAVAAYKQPLSALKTDHNYLSSSQLQS